MKNYQITYSVGSLGEVQLTVYTDVDENDPNFHIVIDNLCMDEIINEVNSYGKIKSFDQYENFNIHRLGLEDLEWKEELTGHDCVWYLVELMDDMKTNPNTIKYWVHSQNPVGKKNMESLLENYLDFYNGVRK